ncbi:MAG TPA: phosphoribosylamine--glycine ligase [Vicinamibacterales bacterium]|nr:phosphoribosylamine--glycine ligase [Vicinamibacterales bacterium]
MRVLILGGGGREHALAWRLSRESDVSEILSAPGNPGLAEIGRCLPVDLLDPDAVLALAAGERVDLTIVGPEAPLEKGVADRFRDAGQAIVGPGARGAALECSKSWAKQFMARHGIPTARFEDCGSLDRALEVVRRGTFGLPVVIKADGLAGGKGVTIAETAADAEAAVREAMEARRFGAAGSRLVIEECLTGPEVSFFVLIDGEQALALGSAQDHKRIFDDDRGPNTGGMGAFAPSPLMTPELTVEVMRTVVGPVIHGMRREGEPYRGFLYVSLMLTTGGPRVIEFNVRFGDPEAQVVLPSLEGRLAQVLLASSTGQLGGHVVSPSASRCVGVVLAAAGYPARPATGQVIAGVARASDREGVTVFHAGTTMGERGLVVAGGRVLTVVGAASTWEQAIARAYEGVGDISFDGMQFRRDIGRKALAAG